MKFNYQDFWFGDAKSILDILFENDDNINEKEIAVISQGITDTPEDVPVIYMTNEPYLFSDWKDHENTHVMVDESNMPYVATLENLLYIRLIVKEGYKRSFLIMDSILPNEYGHKTRIVCKPPSFRTERNRYMKPNLTISNYPMSDTNIQIRNYLPFFSYTHKRKKELTLLVSSFFFFILRTTLLKRKSHPGHFLKKWSEPSS